jgi:hypothetical protein
MKKAGLWAAMVLILAGAILYSLPYVRAYRIVSALKDRDGERLTAYVDFPQIREGLRGRSAAQGRPHRERPGTPGPVRLVAHRQSAVGAARDAGDPGHGLPPPSPVPGRREGRERSAGEIYLAFLRQAGVGTGRRRSLSSPSPGGRGDDSSPDGTDGPHLAG